MIDSNQISVSSRGVYRSRSRDSINLNNLKTSKFSHESMGKLNEIRKKIDRRIVQNGQNSSESQLDLNEVDDS